MEELIHQNKRNICAWEYSNRMQWRRSKNDLDTPKDVQYIERDVKRRIIDKSKETWCM